MALDETSRIGRESQKLQHIISHESRFARFSADLAQTHCC